MVLCASCYAAENEELKAMSDEIGRFSKILNDEKSKRLIFTGSDNSLLTRHALIYLVQNSQIRVLEAIKLELHLSILTLHEGKKIPDHLVNAARKQLDEHEAKSPSLISSLQMERQWKLNTEDLKPEWRAGFTKHTEKCKLRSMMATNIASKHIKSIQVILDAEAKK